MHYEFADYDKYYQIITEAEEGLMAYRKLHPDGIDFFYKVTLEQGNIKALPLSSIPGATTI